MIMEKAVRAPFKPVQELAEMWVEWAELELRNDNFDQAVKIMAKATQSSKRSLVDRFDETLAPQQRVQKSWKLWSFFSWRVSAHLRRQKRFTKGSSGSGLLHRRLW